MAMSAYLTVRMLPRPLRSGSDLDFRGSPPARGVRSRFSRVTAGVWGQISIVEGYRRRVGSDLDFRGLPPPCGVRSRFSRVTAAVRKSRSDPADRRRSRYSKIEI